MSVGGHFQKSPESVICDDYHTAKVQWFLRLLSLSGQLTLVVHVT